MIVSVSPFSSRVRTPLQRYVCSQHGQTKVYRYFHFFVLWRYLIEIRSYAFLATCHNSKSMHWGGVTYFMPK
jgi:hypothetical protein